MLSNPDDLFGEKQSGSRLMVERRPAAKQQRKHSGKQQREREPESSR